MDNIKIFVITHKTYDFPNEKIYSPLLVGANKNIIEYSGEYYTDNKGDNISDKNGNYCELTGLYWIWKNYKKSDFVGLVHYRRYFFKKRFSNKMKDIYNNEEINKIMKENDIILANKKYAIDGNNYKDYKEHHHINDLDMCRKIIEKKYPKYIKAFDVVMDRDYLYPFNMFVMNKDLMNEYCEWLFDILYDLEKNIDISKYDNYNSRIYGFLAERLFNIWIEYKKLKIKTCFVNNIESNVLMEHIQNFIKCIIVKSAFKNICAGVVAKIRKKETKV